MITIYRQFVLPMAIVGILCFTGTVFFLNRPSNPQSAMLAISATTPPKEVEQFDVLNLSFTVLNKGIKPIRMWDFATNCGCSRVEKTVHGVVSPIEALEIAPGHSECLGLRWSVRGEVGEPASTSVRFSTSDPNMPHSIVEFRVNRILGNIVAFPKQIVHDLFLGDEFATELTICDQTKQEKTTTIASVNLYALPKFVNAQLKEVRPDEVRDVPGIGRPIGQIVLNGRAERVGEFEGAIKLTTSGSNEKSFDVPVLLRIQPVIALFPNVAVLPRQSGGELTYNVNVLVRSPRFPVQVVAVEAPNGIVCNWDSETLRQTHILKMSLIPSEVRASEKEFNVKVIVRENLQSENRVLEFKAIMMNSPK